jgi:hypothetical protein
MSRSDGKYDNSSCCRRFLVAGISFSPSDVAASTVFVDVQLQHVTSLITELISCIPEDQFLNRRRLIHFLEDFILHSMSDSEKVARLEQVETMLNSSSELERAIRTFDTLMVVMEGLTLDDDQVYLLTRWFNDLRTRVIAARQPPSQEAQVSDNSVAARVAAPDRSPMSSLSSQSRRSQSRQRRNHHEDDAQGSERIVFFHEELAPQPGEESAGGVSLSSIRFQPSTDTTEAETMTESEEP